MKAEDSNRFSVWFKSGKILYVYVVFPGQQIFMSGINLGKTSKNLKKNKEHLREAFKKKVSIFSTPLHDLCFVL